MYCQGPQQEGQQGCHFGGRTEITGCPAGVDVAGDKQSGNAGQGRRQHPVAAEDTQLGHYPAGQSQQTEGTNTGHRLVIYLFVAGAVQILRLPAPFEADDQSDRQSDQQARQLDVITQSIHSLSASFSRPHHRPRPCPPRPSSLTDSPATPLPTSPVPSHTLSSPQSHLASV